MIAEQRKDAVQTGRADRPALDRSADILPTRRLTTAHHG